MEKQTGLQSTKIGQQAFIFLLRYIKKLFNITFEKLAGSMTDIYKFYLVSFYHEVQGVRGWVQVSFHRFAALLSY